MKQRGTTHANITLRFVNDVRTKQSDMNERLMTVESTVENMSKSLNKTETDVGAVKESVDQISEKIGEVQNTMDRVIDMKLDDMKEEQKEKDKRQNNVILYNVPEKLEGTNDKEVVENLILEELGVREAKVEEITRLGTGNEPRPILLKLNDAQTQRKVLNKAKLLRDARNIYIAPDKTIKEREKYRDLQKELRERKERSQTDLIIRDGKIVKRRDGTKGHYDVRGVHEKANQTRKEKKTGAQAQTTTREKGAVATAGKKQVTKSYSHVLLPPNGEKL